jgi:N-acetylglucosaminyldiphosphoundecaprenol N-acetyl-beta-D-mannosaminyltransferase
MPTALDALVRHAEGLSRPVAAAPSVLVGLSTPEQELWTDRYADPLGGGGVWTVGSLFDYVSGHTPRAPRWLADNGFEWIFRLGLSPRDAWTQG